jgi:hypothetical protein
VSFTRVGDRYPGIPGLATVVGESMFVMSRTTTSLLPRRLTSARVRSDGVEAANARGDWVMEQGVALGDGKAEPEGPDAPDGPDPPATGSGELGGGPECFVHPPAGVQVQVSCVSICGPDGVTR